MSLAENTAGPCFELSVYDELELNKAGLAARKNRKLFRKPIHPLPCPAVSLNILVQAEAEAAQAEPRAHIGAATKQA